MTDIPVIIKSLETAAVFTFFMHDTQPSTIQGWEFDYSKGCPEITNMTAKGGGHPFADSDWVWSHRKDINDWIHRFYQ